MRTILGLIFIVVAAALVLSGAKSLGSSEGHTAGYLAGQMVASFFLPLILFIIGFKWIRPRKVAGPAN